MPRLLFKPDSHPEVTYSDAFVLPQNNLEDVVYDIANTVERHQLDVLSTKDPSLNSGEYHAAQSQYFDYVLRLAQQYNVGNRVSRDGSMDFTPRDGFGNTPIVVANMNQVTGKRMAEVMARMGGSAAIPQDKNNQEMTEIAQYLHSRTQYPTAISLTVHSTIKEFQELLKKRPTDKAVVVNDDGKFLGIISEDRIKEMQNLDGSIQRSIRKDDVVTAKDGITPIEALRHMQSEHVEYLPILASDDTVVGAYTAKEAAYAHMYTSNEGVNGGLAFLPTLGVFNNDPMERIKHFVALGAKGIVLDTAHFDQCALPYRNLQKAREYIEKEAGRHIPIIAGNVITRDAVRRLLSAGADIVKVGIGPGAMCSTRRETGVGRPQLSAIIECAEEANRHGKHIWADGGISDPRDATVALSYASQVMCGTMFAPTFESPAELYKDDNGKVYTINMGMAARQSSELRQAHRNGEHESDMTLVRRIIGHRSEGVQSRVYQIEGYASAADIVHRFMDGLTSTMSYSDA